MIMRTRIAVPLFLTLACALRAEEPKAVPPPFEMESYQLVLLKRGPAWTPERTPETAALQEKHLAHLGRMSEEGVMLLAGPFGDQADESLRGACIYRVASVDEARRLASEDPAVKAGRLQVEVVTWWVGKGYVAFPKAPAAPAAAPAPDADAATK